MVSLDPFLAPNLNGFSPPKINSDTYSMGSLTVPLTLQSFGGSTVLNNNARVKLEISHDTRSFMLPVAKQERGAHLKFEHNFD